MPNIFSRIGRAFLPPPVDPRLLMSDANGLTGQGGLVEQDPAQQQAGYGTNPNAPLGDASLNRVTIPQSAWPQNGGDRRFPPSAFPATGEPQPQQPVSSGPQLPPPDPYIEQLKRQASEQAPNLHPSALRQILGGVAGLTPFSAPFAPLIEYGPKGLQQMREYRQRQAQLPEQVKIGQLSSTDQDRRVRQQETDEARKLREWQERQAMDVNQRNEQDRFAARGGEMLQPQAMDLSLTPLADQPPNPNMQGPQLPPQISLSSGRGTGSLPQRITVPPIAQVPQGYNVEPSAPYDPRGSQRVAPSPATRKRMDLQSAQDVAQAGWINTPDWAKAQGFGPTMDPKVLGELAKERIKPDARVPPEQQFMDEYATLHPGSTKADAIKAYETLKPPTPQDHGVTLIDPKTRQVVRVNPGGIAPEGALTQSGFSTTNTPTAQMRGRGEMANTVIDQIPAILGQIDSLKEKIGPGAGRWNELWVNKAGLNDPEFAGLDQDLHMFASAVAIAHFGARGGQAYREALEKNFSEAQSPDDLKSRIQHAETWMEGYAKAGKGNQASNNAASGQKAGAKTYSQADVDAAVKVTPGATAKQIEDAFKAKGWTKK